MAYVINNQNQEQQNPVQGPVPTGAGTGAVKTSAASGIGAAGGPSTGAPSAAGSASPNAGGQFASLNQYVSANQGAAQPLANQVTAGITNQYNTLQNQNQQTLQGIQGQVNSAYTPENQAILAQESANPVSFASNPTNISSFQQQANDQYTGPTSAEGNANYQTQLANVNSAISEGQAQTATPAGQQQLLQGIEQTPNASVTGLNEAILSQNPNAESQIQNAYQPFSNLTTQLSTGAQGIDTSIGQAQTGATAAANAANAQIAAQEQGLNTNVNNELTTAQNQYQNYENQANNLGAALQSGNLTGATGVDQGLQSFITNNINPWVSQYAPGQTVSYNYANAVPQFPTVAAPTLANVVTPQDMATYNALNQITGTTQQSNLNGLQPGSPFAVPTLPSVNNQAIAGDIAAGLGSVNANVSPQAYQQYLALMDALNNYQGAPNGGNVPNPGTPIPVIS